MPVLKIKNKNGEWVDIPAIRGTDGNGIVSAELNDDYTLTLKYTDGTSYTTPSIRGEQGTSITHEWNGTTLIVTSASGTSYADLSSEVDLTGYATEEYVDNKLANITLDDYQTKVDDALETDSKEIVGAINEVNEKASKPAVDEEDVRQIVQNMLPRIIEEV